MRSVGEVVAGRYRVVRQIAEGGMGVLFEAVHIRLDEHVAIKIVRAAELGADAIARLEREARLAVKLRTEHVARVLDAGRDEAGDPFIVMEYLEGVDLGSLVRDRGPIAAALAADYLVQACHGQAEAHALTIVHRDVKPANLFLTEDAAGLPIIKVLDLGISKAVDSGDEALTSSPERAAQLLGTPHYVSPEQLLTPHEVDARADIWSLGVCGWAIATGAPPFAQNDLVTLFASILNRQAPSIAAARPDLPEAFVRAVDRCLMRKREDRHRDVAELAAILGPLTTERTRPLVEHTRLLLERGRLRALGGNPRSSLASAADVAPAANATTRVEGRPTSRPPPAPDPSKTLDSSRPRAGSVGEGASAASTGDAMFLSHTMPVFPAHARVREELRTYPPPPSLPLRPSTAPPPSASRAPVVVGAVVVAVAAAVLVVVGLRVLPRLRPATAAVPGSAASAAAGVSASPPRLGAPAARE